MSSDSDLARLLSHPAIWRGSDLARVASPSVSSGFHALDAELPGGGWPTGCLTEILAAHEGIGELRILGPALARLSRESRPLAWIGPPHLPYPPALAAAGIDPARLLVVRTRSATEALWATEQALLSGTCGAVIAWPGEAKYAGLRRLALAAEGRGAIAILFRPQNVASQSTPAVLRVSLVAEDGGLAVRLLKRRGGPSGRMVRIDAFGIATRRPDLNESPRLRVVAPPVAA